jgi:hypothetical protein
MCIDGESSRLSLITVGLLIHAALGSESATGVGVPVADVCQNMLSGSTAFVATHPAGSVGGVTASKFSLKIFPRGPITLIKALAFPLPLPAQPFAIV